MASLDAGDRIVAFRPETRLWRTAKVVEAATEQSDTVKVKFVGQNKLYQLAWRHIKLNKPAPTKPVARDLEPPQDSNQEDGSGAQPPTSQPTASPFSDPWKDPPPRTLQSLNQPSKSRESPPPANRYSTAGNYHTSANSRFFDNRRVSESEKPVAREWIANHESFSEWRHENVAHHPGEHLPRASGLAPAVPSAGYWADHPSRPSDAEPSSPYGSLHDRSGGEEPASSSQDSFENPNNRWSPKRDGSRQFRFKPVRTDAGSRIHVPSQYPPRERSSRNNFNRPSAPMNPSGEPRVQAILPNIAGTTVRAQNNSNYNSTSQPSASRPGFSLSVRPRYSSRDFERHPVRLVDEDLRIPRTRFQEREHVQFPRHPRREFDDDIPVPRNIRFASPPDASTSYDVEYVQHNAGTAPVSKRLRLSSALPGEQHLSSVPRREPVRRHLSSRLAKRLKSGDCPPLQLYDRRNETACLPHTHRFARDRSYIRIAPSFWSVPLFGNLPTTVPKQEARFLEAASDDIAATSEKLDIVQWEDSGYLDDKLSIMLQVHRGKRLKIRPKRVLLPEGSKSLCSPRESSETNALSGFTAPQREEQGQGQKDTMDRIPLIYSCACTKREGTIGTHMKDSRAIQCRVCGLWSHLICMDLDSRQKLELQERRPPGGNRYVCIQCIEQRVAQDAFESRQGEGEVLNSVWWQSSTAPLTDLLSSVVGDADEDLCPRDMKDRRRHRSRIGIREHPTEEDVLAKGNNIEQLRAGVAHPPADPTVEALLERLRITQRDSVGDD